MLKNRTKNRWKGSLAVILAAFFCIPAVPFSSFAAPRTEAEEAEDQTASWTEITERRESASRTFSSKDGGEVTAVYPYPVFYEDPESGELTPYDYRLELVTGEEDVKEYKVRDGSMETYVRRFFGGGEFMRIVCGEGRSMALSLPVTDRGRTVTPEFKVQAGLYEKGGPDAGQDSEGKLAAEYVHNYGLCEEVLSGIDVSVEQWPGNVEISAIFQKVSRAKEGLVLSAAFDGLTFEEAFDGSIRIYDGGKEVAVLEAPIVYDGRKALGTASYMISPREDGATQILVKPEDEWMDGLSRTGPVTLQIHITQKGMEEGIFAEVESTEGYYSGVPIAAGNTRETVQTRISLPLLPVLSEGKTLEQVSLVFGRRADPEEEKSSLELGVYALSEAGEPAGEPMDFVEYEPGEKAGICMLDVTKAYEEGASSGGGLLLKSIQTELVTGVYGFDYFVSDMLLPILLVSSSGTKTEEAGGEARIIGEDTEKRDRFTRHFLTEDGTYVAAVYEIPVHYRKDGNWEAIDNTLVFDDEEKVYRNKASDWSFRFAENSADGDLAAMELGMDGCSWGFLEGETDEEGKGSAFEPEHGTGEGELSGTGRYLELSGDTGGKNTSVYNAEQMKRPGLTSGGTYPNVLKNVDIRYVLDSAELKESILFQSKEAAETPIRFLVRHPGLEMSLSESGSVILTRDGKTVFIFQTPYMYDWAGETSGEVSFSLEKESSDATILTIKPDQEWLAEKGRTYPVAVERTVERADEDRAVQTAFVREKQPEKPAEKSVPLPVGYLSGYGISRTLLRFSHLPALENGERITKGILNLYQNQYVSKRTAEFSAAVYSVSEAWEEDASWETQPSFAERALDEQAAKALEAGGVLAVRQFDITSQVGAWYGEENYGVMIASSRENTKAGAGYTLSNRSVRSEPYPSFLYPAGLFYYEKESGVSRSRRVEEQEAARSGQGYVGNFGGNAVFVHEDISGTEERLPGGLAHVYSSARSGETSVYGNGWNLSAAEKLEATGLFGLPYLYTDENGEQYFFSPDQTAENRSRDARGLGLTLTEIVSGEKAGMLVLSGADGSERIFDRDGILLQKRSADGRELFYDYDGGGRLISLSDEDGVIVSFTYSEDGTRLLYLTEEETEKTLSYQYDSVGNLVGILHPDGKSSTYAYEERRLILAKDADGTAVEYLYGTRAGAKRVVMTRTWADKAAEIQTFSYQGNAAAGRGNEE